MGRRWGAIAACTSAVEELPNCLAHVDSHRNVENCDLCASVCVWGGGGGPAEKRHLVYGTAENPSLHLPFWPIGGTEFSLMPTAMPMMTAYSPS